LLKKKKGILTLSSCTVRRQKKIFYWVMEGQNPFHFRVCYGFVCNIGEECSYQYCQEKFKQVFNNCVEFATKS